MKSPAFSPIGIDLVELKKAGSFYEAHKDSLEKFFTAPEIRYISKKDSNTSNLAAILAAKEAVFKTLGKSWMGPEGFKKIQIRPGRGNSFKAVLKNNFKKNARVNRGTFQIADEYVLAQYRLN